MNLGFVGLGAMGELIVARLMAAGHTVTDLAGSDWTVNCPSVLAGAPGAHGELLELLTSVGSPEDF